MADEKFKKVVKKTDNEKEDTKKEDTKAKEVVVDFKLAELLSELLINLIASPFRYLNLITKKLYFYGGVKVRKFFHINYALTLLFILLSSGYIKLMWSFCLLLTTVFYFLAFHENPILETKFTLSGLSLKNQLLKKFNNVKSTVTNNVSIINKSNEVEENLDYEEEEDVVEDKKMDTEALTNVDKFEAVFDNGDELKSELLEDLTESINSVDELYGEDVISNLEDRPINNVSRDELVNSQPEVKKKIEEIDEDVSKDLSGFFKSFGEEFSSSSILETDTHKKFVDISVEYAVEDDL